VFESLDYLYVPAPDFAASLRFYTEVLGGTLEWKIHAFEAWVAGVRLAPQGPLVLLADHLEGGAPIHIYRVADADRAAADLRARGWQEEAGPFGIPSGPCYTFRDPAGLRLAIYDQRWGDAGQRFQGRMDE
jgi:predicted enzyme related to lactoylglutathione lyase